MKYLKIKKIKYIILFLLMFVSIYTFVYVDSYRSDAFKFAKRHLTTDLELIEKYGHIEKVKLIPFGIEIKDRGLRGSANFKVEIKAKKITIPLTVKLKKENGRWEVSSVEEE